MSFTLPTFNVDVNVWSGGFPGGAPRASFRGNLAFGRRIQLAQGIPGDYTGPAMSMTLLLPVGTDVRDSLQVGGADGVEAPAGSGRWYLVTTVDDIGKGFPNEHRAAVLVKSLGPGGLPWPTPIP